MKLTCRHSWKFSHQMPNGEDRVFKHYVCRLCPQTSRRNVKKPRFTATLRRKPSLPSKPSKTPQERPVRKRKAIKLVSDKRKDWLKQYAAKKKADGEFVTAWDLTPTGHISVIHQHQKLLLEPHHPLGRLGCRILFYRWTTPTLHEWIHKRAEWAREEGLILPEMSGRESGPEQPDPFKILPEYSAYVAEHGLH